MEKVAVISDIHGNLEALKSVLKDIKERNVSKIICLGDIIAKGSNSHECIQLIKENCDIVLRGNCDEYFSSNIDLSNKSDKDINRIEWNKSKLIQTDIDYLKGLPYCYEFFMSGRLIRLFHASPEKIDEFVLNVNGIDDLYKMFLPTNNTISKQVADIVVYGHIHMQFMQKIYNRTIINTGSVGNALDLFRNSKKDGNVKNTTVANYLIITGNYNSKNIDEEVSYEMISLPYDINKEIASNDDNIEKLAYIDEIKNGKYRDIEKVYHKLETLGIDINKI